MSAASPEISPGSGESVVPGAVLSADDAGLAAAAERTAEQLLRAAIKGRGVKERQQGKRVARLLADDEGRAFVLALTDEVLRIRDPQRAAEHFERLLTTFDTPQFLGPIDRRLLAVGAKLAGRYPGLIMPLVTARVRAELSTFVVSAEPRALGRHLKRRRSEHFDVNLNLLGEEILGEEEAERRIAGVLRLLGRRDVNYVSVKVSSVCSQLNMTAFDAEVERVASRLTRLYDAALAAEPAKFVNLDMEEYRDLDFTVAVFKRVLSQPAYERLDAGIVLQAYIPDSLHVLEDLLGWARERHARHRSRIRIRLVKGANLANEQVQAEIYGWPQAPFTSKAAVDANYKRMLDRLLDPVNRGAIRVGAASHNLFEIAWALTVAEARGVSELVEIEMLEGMAPSSAQAVRELAGSLLLYTPVARREDAESTIAYLIRRFDENATPENFMHHQFALAPGTPTWEHERARFRASVADRHTPVPDTRRTQNRQTEAVSTPPEFANAPETDLSIAANRDWALSRLGDDLAALGIDVIPVVAGGATIEGLATADGFDPGEPGVPAYRWAQADEAAVDTAVDAATGAGERWRALAPTERAQILRRAGDELERDRGRFLGVMARDSGKTFTEGDAEVSEAVDFARYYADRVPDSAHFTPLGTVAVVPPWNFPLAIPAGGVLAALAAGNAVILKPAPETVAVAWSMVNALWRAGVPMDTCQFLPMADGDAGTRLITHPELGAVILTGAWDTARMFLGWRPDLRLHAETSGKNAIVVTATADLEGAVKDIVRSAFGHAGQKCSAASLAILEASVYDDPRFLRQLADAAASMRVGPSSDPRSAVGPLIRQPEGPLAHALHQLDQGERWLLTPSVDSDNPLLWTPGIKMDVRPGSRFHLTEYFGPVLGLMRAPDLATAVRWQNVPAYGLTAGIESLDPQEIDYWREHVQAGNLYVNRHITGAIVRRQPFGGWKRSVVGPGAKAGGPNYVASLGTWHTPFTGSVAEFTAAAQESWRRDFQATDETGLVSEANVFRYRPLKTVLLRAGAGADERGVAVALAAAAVTGTDVSVSAARPLPSLSGIAVVVEDDATLARRLSAVKVDKLRLIGGGDDALRLAGHDAGLWLDDTAVVGDPRLELLRWAREQALSETRHRHGNVTGRFPGPLVGV
jgi:RHH-type proline utilization regulon transcriptional repressor/proline dehydrogenase/delta 1-pyrroline-5-carboxylate dehydrogenase